MIRINKNPVNLVHPVRKAPPQAAKFTVWELPFWTQMGADLAR